MERKAFIRTCGFACMSGSLLTVMLEGCGSTKMINGTIANTDLVVPAAAFLQKGERYRKYVVVQHDQLAYPICLYRFSENRYSALLMRCTHQGTELQVFGDRLQCPAHCSEFTNQGVVKNGPADTNLRTFPVTVQNDQIYISLKK
jgi:nitrite reductase/ring-hydroxylating ferredoxin subunit